MNDEGIYGNGQLATACDPTDTPARRVCTTYANGGPGNRLSLVTRPEGNGQVTLYALPQGSRVGVLVPAGRTVQTLDFTADGSKFAVTHADGSIDLAEVRYCFRLAEAALHLLLAKDAA